MSTIQRGGFIQIYHSPQLRPAGFMCSQVDLWPCFARECPLTSLAASPCICSITSSFPRWPCGSCCTCPTISHHAWAELSSLSFASCWNSPAQLAIEPLHSNAARFILHYTCVHLNFSISLDRFISLLIQNHTRKALTSESAVYHLRLHLLPANLIYIVSQTTLHSLTLNLQLAPCVLTMLIFITRDQNITINIWLRMI